MGYKKAVTLLTALAIGLGSAAVSAKTQTVTWLIRDPSTEVLWAKQSAEKFMKANPNIKIKIVISSQAQYDDKLLIMMSSGQSPDIWSHIGSSGFMDYKTRNLILDLTNYIRADKFDLSDFMPRTLSPYTIGGKVWGIPTGSYASFTYYNTDLFKQNGITPLPTSWNDNGFTWDRMVENAKKIAKDNNGDGKLDIGGIYGEWHFTPDLGLAWNWGGDLWPEETYQTGFPTKSTIDSPEMIAAYKAYTDLKFKYKVWGGDFNSGKQGMLILGTWQFDGLRKVKKLNWDLGVIPKGPAGRIPVLYVDPWVIGRTSKAPKAAWEFVKYITGPEAQKDWITVTGKMPSRKSQLTNFMKSIPNVDRADMVELLNGAFVHGREADNHTVVNYRQYDRVVGQYFTDIKNGKVSVEQGLKDAHNALNKAIAQYANKRKLGSF